MTRSEALAFAAITLTIMLLGLLMFINLSRGIVAVNLGEV